MANQDSGPMILKHLLDMQIHGSSLVDSGSITINMELDMSVYGNIPIVSEPILIVHDLDMSISNTNAIQDSEHIYMLHLLDMSIYQTQAYCMGLIYNFIPQRLEINTCENDNEESEMIERYEGDTYPLEIVFSKNGNYNISGYTFKLYAQIEDGGIYEMDGTIMNAEYGLVLFYFDTNIVNSVGSGVYEIKVINGGTTTFAHGELKILDALSVA